MGFDLSSPIVVHSELETAGAYLNSQAEGIAEELNQLAQYLAALEPIWTGPAASYYQPLQAEWNLAAMGLFGPDGVLGEIAQAMNVTWGNYSDCEWTNAQAWAH